VLITSGEGRAGEIVQPVTAAPRLLIVGVILRAVPTVPVVLEKVTIGVFGLTVREIVPVLEPAEFVAVIV